MCVVVPIIGTPGSCGQFVFADSNSILRVLRETFVTKLLRSCGERYYPPMSTRDHRRGRGTAPPETASISALSRRSGVPVATIKYYIREGLIQPGQDRGVDDEETVD